MLLLKRRHKQALEELNQVIVLYAWFLPALVEKFSVLIAMGDWDQVRLRLRRRRRSHAVLHCMHSAALHTRHSTLLCMCTALHAHAHAHAHTHAPCPEQAVETAQRVLSQDQHNIEALRLSVLFLLSQESRYDAAKNRISDLLQARSGPAT